MAAKKKRRAGTLKLAVSKPKAKKKAKPKAKLKLPPEVLVVKLVADTTEFKQELTWLEKRIIKLKKLAADVKKSF